MADETKSSTDETKTDSTGNKTAKTADAEVPKDKKDQETKPLPKVDKVASVVDDDDDDLDNDDADGESSDEKETFVQITQTQLNDLINKRVNKIRSKSNRQIEKLQSQVTQLTSERDNYKTGELARVKSEFESLPEEVKAMAPATVDKFTSDDSAFKRVVEWMPKAKKITERIQGTPPKTTPKHGNLPDPNPAGGTKVNPGNAEVTHPMYRSL